MQLYQLHGCTVASDLPFYLPHADESLVAEMVLRRSTHCMDVGWEPKPDELLARVWIEARGVGYAAARTPEGYRLRFDDLCDFDISSDLIHVTWTLLPGRDPGLVSVLAAGTLMAFRLTMARHLVLHASAVRARGRGLAFVGASGMGKSTMATLMCAGGASLLTDDVGRITFDGGDALLSPGGIESRLRPGSVQLTELLGSLGAIRSTSDGRTAVSLPCWTDGPVALDAVVIPIPSRQQTEVELTALSPAQALILLGQFPRISGWVDTEVLDHQFNRVADLVERVPAYIVVVPWGPPFVVETGRRLLDRLGWADEMDCVDGLWSTSCDVNTLSDGSR